MKERSRRVPFVKGVGPYLNEAQYLQHSQLSTEASAVLDLIGQGKRLFIQRSNRNVCFLRAIPPFPCGTALDISAEIAAELVSSGIISELPEFRDHAKTGWKEMGLDGDNYAIYACTQ